MEFNRNQYFFFGILVVLVGMQLRMVSHYVLTPETTRFLAEQTGKLPKHDSNSPMKNINIPKKVVEPPQWLGWCLISVGAVLVLHSLAMKKPG